MAREYSLVHLTYMGWTPPEMIYNANLIGFDRVSPRTICMGLPGEKNYDITGDNALYRATKQALKDTGMAINDIELAKIDENTCDIRTYERHLEAAAGLGVMQVITNIWTPDEGAYTEKFAALCDMAAQYGMTVNLEFVTWAKVPALSGARKIIDAVGKPNARILLDMLHFYRSRVPMEELEACPEGLIGLVHICDAPPEIPTDEPSLIHTGRAARLYPGDGAVDIAGIIRRLKGDVVFGIEIPNAEMVERIGPTEHVRRCLVRTKEYLAANGIV